MLARAGLMNMIEELSSMPLQQSKAKVAELVGVGVPKQEEIPELSKESGRGHTKPHCPASQPL